MKPFLVHPIAYGLLVEDMLNKYKGKDSDETWENVKKVIHENVKDLIGDKLGRLEARRAVNAITFQPMFLFELREDFPRTAETTWDLRQGEMYDVIDRMHKE